VRIHIQRRSRKNSVRSNVKKKGRGKNSGFLTGHKCCGVCSYPLPKALSFNVRAIKKGVRESLNQWHNYFSPTCSQQSFSSQAAPARCANSLCNCHPLEFLGAFPSQHPNAGSVGERINLGIVRVR